MLFRPAFEVSSRAGNKNHSLAQILTLVKRERLQTKVAVNLKVTTDTLQDIEYFVAWIKIIELFRTPDR
ncbi:MAG: hypothetical protein BWY75_03356 [bacterium ADurb.Bin425]|nr:MAG: hypothetical protein BWY75_03356 [bacterium ADurb.Bin425]